MSTAQDIMKSHNRNALVDNDDGVDVMIEDVADPDGRLFRVEYQSTEDGRHAVAVCRYNPWGSVNGGEEYEVGHVDADGFICIGKASVKSVESSPYTLVFAIARARYWCTAFSVLKETGEFPEPTGDQA